MMLLTILSAFASCTGKANAEVVPVKEDAPEAVSQLNESGNNNDFACKLFRTICEQKPSGSSTIVSPISVSYVLGMLNEGANGKTRQQITEVLDLGTSVKEINEYFKKMMDKAQSIDPKVTVKIANCLDVISEYRINPQYKADMQNYYNAQCDAVSYNASSILANINNWCKAQTDDMIPEILSKDELNPNRVMYLLNAVYFKASWTDEFDPKETRDMDFITLDDKTVKRPMMHRNGKAKYGRNDLGKMLRLPYGNGGWSMYVLLPDEGKTIDYIIHSLSAQKLEEWRSHMRTVKVDILMPHFTTESETPLEVVLSSMGMPRAFGNRAEFPNMIQGHKDDLYVSLMKQKAKIEVNEEGTKAAAVTVAEVAEKGVDLCEDFHATRPFVYYIMEESTGTIFFMGTYCFEDNDGPLTLKYPERERETTFGRYIGNDGKKSEEKRNEDEIFKSVEQMPQFPGGEAELYQYIQTHIQYPPEYGDVYIQGRVVVQFVVEKDGSIGEVKVVRSLDKNLDAEAVRLVKSLPKFTPARQNGQVVRCWYTLPVTFKLRASALE
jgi:serpin B